MKEFDDIKRCLAYWGRRAEIAEDCLEAIIELPADRQDEAVVMARQALEKTKGGPVPGVHNPSSD